MSLAAKEYTPEELDALEAQAKQRPVYDQIAGGVGAAMAYYDGPQETKAEYTPEELDVRDALYAQPELTPEELDQRLVNAKYDANTLLPPEQLKEADAVEKRLRDQGKQPGIADTAFALGGGILQSVADWNMALDKGGNVKAAVKNVLIKTGVINGDYERMPMLEAALQAPASAKAGVQGAALNAMETAIALNGLAKGKPRYRVKETGEFVFAPLGGVAPLTQLAGEGKTLVPVTDADLEEHRYQQYATENAIRKTYLDVTSEEVLGQAPNQSFTLPVEIAADPWNLIAFGAANKVTGAARMGKLFSSKTLGAAEAVAGGSANIIDKGADVFTKAVQKMSFGLLKRDTQRAIAKSAAYGGGAAAVGTMLTNAPSEARNTALALMSLYPMYKMGSGVLRRVEGVAGTGKLIMREAADATNGLDDVARAAVASNPKVPQQIREVLTNPSKFTPIESTPARIAKSEAFSPRVREVAASLANPLVVQASRAAGATARGAALGTALNIPFAEAYREMGDERTADSVYAGGLLFGAAGGAASRVTGARARRRDAAVSDIGRMLVDIQKTNAGEDIGAPGVNRAFETYYSMAEPGRMLTDVELAGGDIDSLLRNTKFEDLAGMAAMQGFYRDTVDFVPLNAFDYEANVKALGGTGTAGYFLHAPEGQRARLFLNADARRTDVAPHEYGHALLQSAATSPEMKNSARAFINQRYGPERLDAMAREYAGQLIKNRNAKSFPDQKMDVSEAEIDSMIYELGESGLGRGDGDRLDWLRDEIFAEEHRAAGVDYAQIRRNIPDGFSVVGFAENVLGANARALGVAGVPIDPQTGALQTPPDRLFKDSPLLAADSVMRRNVQQYVRAYKQWLNDPAHEVPTGAAVSRTGNPNELKNNPNVTFRGYGNGRLENELAFIDESGNVKVKDKKNDPERAKFIRARQQQVREMIDRGTKEPNDPTFGARVRDGQRIVAGKRLPPRFDMTRFPAPLKDLARRTEALAEAGETMQVRYFALGKSKDVFKQGDRRGVQAINREVMFVEWQATKDGNINAFVVDLTQFRNRAMKAIADRDPSLSEINWDFKQLEADLRRVLDNHANGRAGADGIGDKRRNAVNALLGIGTKTNRIANPLTGLGGKGSALKTLRLDALDEVAGTGRQGFEFDYQKANGNFMPDQPAPRPNMDSDLELPNRMPSALPQAGMAMPDVAVVPERFTGTGQEPNRQSRFAQPPPFFARFPIESYERGGKFFDAQSGEDLTGRSYCAWFIDVSSGKPRLFVDGDPAAQPAKSGRTYRTNLFKQKAGWKWTSDNAPATSTIVSVEGGGRHVYALRADFEGGVDLARYSDKPSEPRLRPTARGELSLGNEVGRISIRGKEHPVYDGARISQPAAARGQAMPYTPANLSTDQILRELEENQGYLGLSTLGMREWRPVKGGAQQTRELLKRNTALNEELRRRGGPQEESDVERVLRQRGQAMPDVGININDSTQPFTSQILSGEKTIETRDTDSLRPYVGKRIGLVKTGAGQAMLVGYADVGEPTIYASSSQFRRDEALHRVAKGSKFDIKQGGKKFGYPMTNVQAI